MVAEFQLFKPRKYADAAEWNLDMQAKLDTFGELEKAGAEKSDDLQQFLSEVVWSVIRGELTGARAVEFLAKTPISSRESLQRIFADVLWLVGFSATESQPERAVREEFHGFCASLEREGVLSRPVLASTLETDSVPPAVCQVQLLKKKNNQAKTKARYTITRYNLMKEHSDGYSKLVVLLERLACLGFEPEASPEQLQQSKDALIEDVVRLAGFGYLCPNRILSMTLDVFERKLSEGTDQKPLAQPLLSLMHRLPPKRLSEVAVFQLLAHTAAPASGRDARPAPPPQPPSRPSQFLAVAALISAGLLDLDMIWTYLDPADAAIKEAHADVMSRYDDELSSVSKVDLGSSSSSQDKHGFKKAFQAFNQAGYQKFRLAAALISVNSWRHVNKVLLHLQRLCKPCLNHHIRSALCDLLKWLISPLLRPLEKKGPHKTKFTLETSYACQRRFNVGAQQGESGDALKQATDFESLLPQMKQVLEHLEHFLHTDLHLLVSLWRVLQMHLKQREKAAGGDGKVTLDDTIVAVIYRHLLPAASLVPHNPQLSDVMWTVLSQLSVFQRFLIYSCWETQYDGFLLKLAHEKTKAATKQILKRVVANAEKRDLIAHQAHFHVCKLCHSNPIPAIDCMLRDVEIGYNVNMIQPYVECTTRCPEMTADIMNYVLTRSCMKPVSPTRPFLNQADATLSPWLVNLGEFVGRFYKKHPTTDLHGLLTVITRRINNEAVDTGSQGGSLSLQAEYKGESLIRVILESLIEYMGGYTTVADMTAEQLRCLAGGPRLKSESIAAVGRKEDATEGRKEKTRAALFNTLVDLGLVPVLWYSLSQQRHHFLSEEFSEVHGGAGGLKLLGLLFDGNHECLLKLTEFLAQACAREKYMSLLPPLQEVFNMFEPQLAFHAARHGLAPYGRAPSPAAMAALTATAAGAAAAPAASAPAGAANGSSAPAAEPKASNGEAHAVADGTAPTAAAPEAAATNGTNGSGASGELVALADEDRTVAELEKVVRTFLPSIESDGLSMHFYITFWRLALQDIYVPADGYNKAIAGIAAGMKQIEFDKKMLDRTRDSAHSKDYRALKKEAARLQDFHAKLKEEQLAQKYNYEKVSARLEREKGQWFLKSGPQGTMAFVSEMICPRVLTSHADALFCSHFVRLIIKLRTPGFHTLDFYNCWTVMLTQKIRCCSEREAQIFGVFLREMMSYIIHIRRDEASYNSEVKENPCFHRNYYMREDLEKGDIEEEFLSFMDIRKGHSKWEGRIHKAMRQGLESEDWMEKRNLLMLLSQCYEAFPVVEKYASQVLACVENLHAKEELSDLKTLANSVIVKLKSRREHWVEKGAPSLRPTADVASSREHGRRGSDDGRRARSALPALADSTSAAQHSDGRSPRRSSADGKRSAPPTEQDGAPPDRRSRREEDSHGGERHESKADVQASQGGERSVKDSRDPKDHKEPKEHKEAKEPREAKEKTRDRGEPKAAKDARDPKDARASEKAPKESRDPKDSKRATSERVREKESVDRTRSDKDREREKAPERSSKSSIEKELVSADRKRSGTSSSAPAPAPSHAPAHPDERPEKRRRSERDGEGGHTTAVLSSSSRSGGGGSTSDRAAGDRHGYGSSSSARNALTPPPEPAGSNSKQYYHSGGGTSSGGRDYDRRGSSYPSHTSGHSGGRYGDAHRNRSGR